MRICILWELYQQISEIIETKCRSIQIQITINPFLFVQAPKIDLILAVKDPTEWHKENLEMNKQHYTYMARITHLKVINALQKYGARMHFNFCNLDAKQLEWESDDEQESVQIRYGIIQTEDMMRDL